MAEQMVKESSRGRRNEVVGEVVSDKMDKSITVLVQRRYMHPVYKKYVMRTDKYTAHDENNQFKAGDRVQIIECRPISKTKRWTVVTGDAPANPAPKKAEEAQKEAKKPAPKKPAAKKKTTAKKKD